MQIAVSTIQYQLVIKMNWLLDFIKRKDTAVKSSVLEITLWSLLVLIVIFFYHSMVSWGNMHLSITGRFILKLSLSFLREGCLKYQLYDMFLYTLGFSYRNFMVPEWVGSEGSGSFRGLVQHFTNTLPIKIQSNLSETFQ